MEREVGKNASIFGTSSASKKFSLKYPNHSFIRTSMNTWKSKFKGDCDGDVVLKKVRTLNILDNHLIRKVKDIAIGTRQAGRFINRSQISNIAKDVISANNSDILKEFNGTLKLTDRGARGILTKLNRIKRKGKTKPSPQFLAEEKFAFQRAI